RFSRDWSSDVCSSDLAPMQSLRRPLPPRSVLFLERRAGFWGDRVDHRISAPIRQLVAAAVADPTLDVDLVPINVLWGRAPDKEAIGRASCRERGERSR